ncbi:MAG TPA: multidrug effflux MFS transporter [Gemmatimonadaceae bacterium]|nr:multidrug effflux MFS transporter [Gemmatimonadaceae bacterium]
MRRLRPHTVGFTFLLGALATLASFATDMGLPVLGPMAQSLGVAPGRAALSLSVFMVGFALGPLVFGPVSDHVGRRPVLLAGVAAFATFGAFGAFSRTLGAVLLWRLLMGVGAGTCSVLVVAMVRDLFTGVEARVRQSYVNLAAGIAPIIAPTLGVAVATLGGWRAIYGALAAGGAVLLTIAALQLGETLPPTPHESFEVRRAIEGYARVLSHRVSIGYAAVIALNFGSLFAYVSGSSLVLIGILGVSPRMYGLLFAATSLGLMTGALTNARLSRRGVPHARLITWGLAIIVVTSVLLLALTIAGAISVWVLVPLAVVGFVGQGIVRPNAVQGALEPVPEIAGVASAVLTALQMLVGGLSSAIVAAWFDGRSAISVTAMMSITALASATVYALVVRPAEHRAALADASAS